MQFNQIRFLEILSKMIEKALLTQNFGAVEPLPNEREIVNIVRSYLDKHQDVLDIKEFEYVKNRPNVLITYKGTTPKLTGLIGAHMDVVPANAKTWTRAPFKMIQEGDKVYGRGTTDCLGHVAALTEFLLCLATEKPKLSCGVAVLLIANEESLAVANVGVERIVEEGVIDFLKGSTALWLDSSEFGPCIGTKGVACWTLTVKGKRAHSGYPEKGVNALTLAAKIMDDLQRWFYNNTPQLPIAKELEMTPPSLSPTLVTTANDAVNAIPAEVTIKGDMRVPPGYKTQELMAQVKTHVDAAARTIQGYGPEKYEGAEVLFSFADHAENPFFARKDTPEYAAVLNAMKKAGITPHVETSGGTLPAIGDLQQKGVAVFAVGFGKEDAYHQDNEYAHVSDFMKGLRFLWEFVSQAK